MAHNTRHEGDWENGLCGWAGCGNFFGKTSGRIDPDAETKECVIFGAIQLFTGCGCLYNMVKREEIRKRYNIEGSHCGDCCTSFWCMCCALTQQENEVKSREAVTGAYQAQPPMMSTY
ncbi:hypothetical protein ED733_000679 [Metarhizium rileyi]|uniref:PLAC8 family protein n=1 Tax=Metarhizium rileyi (strain RCEF 4871) TaxID=1649241 RepID=A0A5C6GKB3_METRR|nr:hypothetical protein ED733_000679 [Metarhizium rileyi]